MTQEIVDNRDKEIAQPYGHPLGTTTCVLVWEVFPDISVEEAWGINAANKTINAGFRKWWKRVRGKTELRGIATSDTVATRLRFQLSQNHVHSQIVLERRNMNHLFAEGDVALVRKLAESTP